MENLRIILDGHTAATGGRNNGINLVQARINLIYQAAHALARGGMGAQMVIQRPTAGFSRQRFNDDILSRQQFR